MYRRKRGIWRHGLYISVEHNVREYHIMRYSAILVDGRNLLHRAAHGGKDLTTKVDGKEIPIGAVYQFIRSATLLYDEYAAPRCGVIVAWEGDRDGSWRREAYPSYKLREPNEDINAQETILRALLTTCGWSQGWSPRSEADDTLATAAEFMERRGAKVAIVTGDHDLHQCVTENVHIVDPNGHRYDLTNNTWKLRDVLHQWEGVTPDRIVDVKALMGDTSDGIPGASGIGKMWAFGLMRSYNDLDTILDFAEENDEIVATMADGSEKKSKITKRSQGKVGTLREEREQILLYRRLVTTVTDADIRFARRCYDADGVIQAFRKLKFSSLLAPSTLRTIAKMAGTQGAKAS